jgi:hypothetical protein
MLGVDYIFHKEYVDGTRVSREIFDKRLVDYVRLEAGRHIVRVKQPLPRAFFVRQVVKTDEKGVVAGLRAADYVAEDTAYIAGFTGLSAKLSAHAALNSAPSTLAVSYREEGPNRFLISYTSDVERPLFISNVLYPGWRAFVADRELPIYSANLAFMLVMAPAASSGEIRFEFRPTNMRLYVALSIFAVGGSLLIAFGGVGGFRFGLRRRRRLGEAQSGREGAE